MSDLRAPTPTAAAEKAVPVRDELIVRIEELNLRFKTSFNNKLNNNKDLLNNLIRLLGKPDQIFENKAQKLDLIYRDMENLFKETFVEKKNIISQIIQRLTPPMILINNLISKQQLLETKFKSYLENIITNKETKLHSFNQLLESSNFNKVLGRGFALVMDNNGKPIKLSSQAPKNASVNIRFHDKIRKAILDN